MTSHFRHFVKYSVLILMSLTATPASTQQREPEKDVFVLWGRGYDLPHVLDTLTMLAEVSRDQFGDFEILRSEHLEQGRAVEEMVRGQLLNVAVFGTDAAREQRLLPIYYPVEKGMLGLRICLIRTGEQARFDKIWRIDDLRQNKLRVGVGSHWPDTPILQRNQVPLETSPVYENLFKMLAQGRFDCMTRSVNEIEQEFA